MNSIKIRRKTDYPPLIPVRLLEQLRERIRIRYKHHSLSAENNYVYGVRAFVRIHKLRHPREMGNRKSNPFSRGMLQRVSTRRAH